MKNKMFYFMIAGFLFIAFWGCSDKKATQPSEEEFEAPDLRSYEYVVRIGREVGGSFYTADLDYNPKTMIEPYAVIIINNQILQTTFSWCESCREYYVLEISGNNSFDFLPGEKISVTLITPRGTSPVEMIVPHSPQIVSAPSSFVPNQTYTVTWTLSQNADFQYLLGNIDSTVDIYVIDNIFTFLGKSRRTYSFPVNTTQKIYDFTVLNASFITKDSNAFLITQEDARRLENTESSISKQKMTASHTIICDK